jgi:hypothetical protein
MHHRNLPKIMSSPELLLNVILSRRSNLCLTYYSFVAGDGNAMGDASTSTGRRRRPSRIFLFPAVTTPTVAGHAH